MNNLLSTMYLSLLSSVLLLGNPPGIKKYQTLDELQDFEFNQFSMPQELEELQNQVYLDLEQMDVCWKLLEGLNDEIILELVKSNEKVESHIIQDFETTQDGATIYLYDSNNDTWYWFSDKYRNIEKELEDKQKVT